MIEISAQTASAQICGAGEAALLDLREAGQFGEGHALFAVPAPWSRLELDIGALVPRQTVAVMLIDAGDGVAQRAAGRIEAMGYTDVQVVAGGMPGWAAAGLPVYKGVNVPSKTLGELVEAVWHPTMIQPETLADWMQSGQGFRFFDARPPVEYGKMRVPGSTCLPNGELAHRVAALPGRQDPIVITCAGRTRGIVGAIGMRISGHEGPVLALENGTQGWALAGEVLERGNDVAPFPDLDANALAASRAAADRIIAQFAIPEVTTADLISMRSDASRSTYLFDTRSAPEAQADPVAAAVHAPSGQLAQATDQWIGVRRARVVLCCDTGLRSALAAFWLRQIGFQAMVLRLDDALRALPAIARIDPACPALPVVEAEAALKMVHAGTHLIDLRASAAYRKGHVAGAYWSRRPLLPALVGRLRQRSVLLIADDVGEAELAAHDLRIMGVPVVRRVEGGTAAMIAAGAAREVTPHDPKDHARIDHLFFVHDRHDGNLEASRRYLAWETGLVGQLTADERAQFQLFPAQ